MSSVTYDGNILSVKLKGNDETWKKDFALIKSIPGRRFKSGVQIWEIPPTEKNIKLLRDNNFTFSDCVPATFDEKVIKRFRNCPVIDPGLLPPQVRHAQNIIFDLVKNRNVLDGSETGTGKTYVALAVAKFLNLYPVIFTTKSVVPGWYSVAKETFGIKIFASNYEQYKLNKTPYVTVTEKRTKKQRKFSFQWELPERCILIFDEIHKCKNSSTINSKMLLSAKKTGKKIIGLSATIASDPLQMYTIGRFLGIFDSWKGYMYWSKQRGVKKNYWGIREFVRTPEALKKIHEDIYPYKGSRLKTKDFGDLFPENRIISKAYQMGSAKRIQELYTKMEWEINNIRDRTKNYKQSVLTDLIKERMEIEILKVPTMVELTQNFIEEGNSIILFLNFRETINVLSYRLKTKCIIDGKVSGEKREKNRKDFQEDRQRVILCNTAAGGVGISLHDIYGNYPRVTLVSPTYSPDSFIQCLGRAPRAKAKSKVIQYILYCAGTKEEEIAQKVALKVENIKLINDGDLF
jgi:superfamily II DNA or RNA helicase